MKMLVLTGLFFNKKGNQSFINSIKGYIKEYDVTMINAATVSSDVYHKEDYINELIPQLRVISVFPDKLFRFMKKLVLSLSPKKRDANSDVKLDSKYENQLVNLAPTLSSKVSFYFRSFLLAFFSLFYCLIKRPDVICCYEINGVIAAKLIKKIFGVPVFIKLQGTALGGSLNELGTKEIKNIFSIDIASIQSARAFDAAIMTNDGTLGDKVLDYYGYDSSKLLFINNGIEPLFTDVNTQKKAKEILLNKNVMNDIKLVVVSRLTAWKRVDVVIKAIAEFTKIDSRNIHLTLVGVGSSSEKQEVQKLISELELDSLINFVHGASISKIIDFIIESDLLISVNKFTNVSNPVFEALYLNRPVITIKQSELGSVLGPGVESCIFLDDGKELVLNLSRAISSIDTKLYNSLTNNHSDFLDFFPTWETRSNKELEFLKNRVLNESNK